MTAPDRSPVDGPSPAPATGAEVPGTKPQLSRARRWLKRCGWVVALVLLVVIVRYGAARFNSGSQAVRVMEHPVPVAPANEEPAPAAGGPQADSTGQTLRVAAWNIAHGRGTGADNHAGGSAEQRAERLRGMAGFLRSANLDVVVLNEVDFDAAWSHGVNQAAALARLAGFGWHVEQRNFDVLLPGYTLRFGNAILSRHPIIDARLVELPAYRRVEALFAGSKQALLCTLQLPDETRVRVLAVHLSHRSEHVRLASVEVIRQLAEDSQLPLIAAGDFNSAPPGFPQAEPVASGETAMGRLLEGGLFRTLPTGNPSPVELTWPALKPDRLLDWVTVTPPLKLMSKSVYPLDLSDHLPVVVTVQLGSEPVEP
ncbi:MAG: endonuclease/exonuclease/phosphatase family protein [Planctomycetaceae bacterium]|nr:endonuclease/exonuclease/phosphatase family protein [Planctomycetaceae bacterium]